MRRLKSVYHYILAGVANLLYRFPSKKIYVIGVTGTKGKSTTVELINAALEAVGKKTALCSSIRFKIAGEVEKNTSGMTMPGRLFLQRFLRRAVSAGCEYAIVEVTSQGILQHRHRFIQWDAALITNIRPEHIDAHGSFENYRNSKVSFFDYAGRYSRKRKTFFINEGDQAQGYFAEAADGYGNIVYFSRERFIDKDLNQGRDSIGDWLFGNFNLENAAAANAVAQHLGVDWPIIKKTFKAFQGVPGRMEYLQREPFGVVIDYAHTPDSLAKIYNAVLEGKKQGSAKKLICALGAAGGGRDKWKRPVMGRIASEHCREIVLTNEDPFDEDPLQIIEEIKAGISPLRWSEARSTKWSGNAPYVYEILDRRAAIEKALSFAKKGDVVVITGKGSEDWIRVANGKKIPWNERKVTKEILQNLNI